MNRENISAVDGASPDGMIISTTSMEQFEAELARRLERQAVRRQVGEVKTDALKEHPGRLVGVLMKVRRLWMRVCKMVLV